MPNVSFDSLSPSQQLRWLHERERTESDERSDQFCSLVEAFRERLRTLSSSEIMELLAQAVGNSAASADQQGYWCCVSELHRRADPSILATCAAWAASQQPSVREASANVLAQLGYGEAYPFAQRSQPILEGLLADPETGVVSAALIALGHLRVGDLPLITGHAKQSNADVRLAVVHALLSRDEPLAQHTLIELSRDIRTDVRDWATFALGSIGKTDSPEIRDALAARLVDEDNETRGEALIGLAARKDQRVIPAICKELARGDVSQLAIEAAGRMPHESFLPGLEALLKTSPNDEHVIAALAACRAAAS